MQTAEAPNTVLEDRPAAISNQRLARFTFSAEGTVTDFKCAIDGGGDVRCVSPFETDVGDGEHSIRVTAFNGAAGDETPETYAWLVDATPPDTTILTGPPSLDNSTTVEVTFTGAPTDDVTGFQCSLDMAEFVACTSPQSYAGLVSGEHSIRVRAVDAANNPDPTPAIRSWTLDTSTPDTMITGGPEEGSTSGANVEFSFSSPDPTAVFECRFDNGAATACSSPTAYNGLSTGTHTFTVGAKNPVSGVVDPTPETRMWTVDGGAPVVTIDTAPTSPTNDATSTFTFSSSDTDIAGYECQIDGQSTFAACTSPFDGPALADGTYTFRVRATDSVGNTATDSHTWTIDTAAPSVVITAGPEGPTSQTTASFTFNTSGSPTTVRCSLDNSTPIACTSPQPYTGLQDGMHTFVVTVADAAGNSDSDMRTFEVITAGPSVTITSGPSGPTTDSTPTYTFTTTNAVVIECRIDGGTFSACTSPFTSQTLSEGLHSFEVRVRDVANTPASDSRSFTVDTISPTVSILTGPNGPTNDTTPTFTFVVGGSPSTTQCRFDTGTFVSCSSPFTASPALSNGGHTFEVRVADLAGNTNSATRPFSVVTNGPTVTITSGPSGPTSANTATFTFTTTGSPTTIECQVDAGAFAACSSPFNVSALPDGSHSFTVRVRDLAGNENSDSRTYVIDTEAPAVVITSGPNGPTNLTGASFGFTHTGVSVTCRFDTQPFAPCTSPVAGTFADGPHTVEVRSTDAAGNAASATRSWTVDTMAPTVTIGAPSGTSSNSTNPAEGTTITDPTPTFTFTTAGSPTLIECRVDSALFTACTSPFTSSELGGAMHSFTVRVTDAAGNTGTAMRSFTVDSQAPTATLIGPTTTCPADTGVGCTGVVSDFSPTRNNRPSFTINLTGDFVQVRCRYDGGTIYNCLPPTGSSVVFPYPAAEASLIDGAHTFTVQACNASFICSNAVENFFVDTVAPTIAITAGPSGGCGAALGGPSNCFASNDSTPDFTFSTAGAATQNRCRVNTRPVSGSPVLGTFASCGLTLQTLSTLTDGRYTLESIAYDQAFNPSTPVTKAFDIDTTPPDISFTQTPGAPEAVAYRSTATNAFPGYSFQVSAEEHPGVFKCVNTSNDAVLGTGTTTEVDCNPAMPAATAIANYKPFLAEGTYGFRAKMTDTAGNVTVFPPLASTSLRYRIDDTRPTVVITGPTPASPTFAPRPAFNVKAVNNAPGGVTPSPINAGAYACSFTDNAGRTVGCTINFADMFTVAGATVTPLDDLVDPAAHLSPNQTLSLTIIDVAQNATTVTPTFTFTIDQTPPTVLGPSAAANPTISVTSPTNAGSATYSFVVADERPGVTTACEINDVVTACSTATTLTRTFAADGSQDGSYKFEVIATDAALNVVPKSETILVDRTRPNAAFVSPTALSNVPTQTFNFTVTNTAGAGGAAPPSAIATRTCAFLNTGGAALPEPGCTVSGGPTFTATPTSNFTDGNYSVTLTITDAAGNVRNDVVHTFTIDLTPPVLTNLAASGFTAGTTINDTTPSFTIDTNDVSIHSVACRTTAAGAFTAIPVLTNLSAGPHPAVTFTLSALPDGAYAVSCQGTDTLGNGPSTPIGPINFSIDASPPSLTNFAASGFTAGTTINDTTPSFTIDTNDASVHTVSCRTTAAGAFSPVLTNLSAGPHPASTFTLSALPDGAYAVSCQATDSLGNATASPAVGPINFSIDATAPVLTNLAASGFTAGTTINDTTPSFTINTNDASVHTVSCRTTAAGSFSAVLTNLSAGPHTGETFTLPALPDGAYAVSCQATDSLGNGPSTPIGPVSFTIDATAPTLANLAPSGFTAGTTIDDTTPSFTIDTNDASVHRVECRTTAAGSFSNVLTGLTAGPHPTTSFTLPALADGAYAVSCQGFDSLGNGPSALVGPVSFTVDNTAPTLSALAASGFTAGTTIDDDTPSFTITTNDVSVHTVECRTTAAGAFTAVLTNLTAGPHTNEPFTLPTLPDGAYAVSCRATDSLNNGPSAIIGPVSFTVDSSAPTLSALAPAGFAGGDTINDNTPSFTITTNDVSVHTVECRTVAAGGFTTVLSNLSAGPHTNEPFTLSTLADGVYAVSCQATDSLGNGPSTIVGPVSFTVDTAPPTFGTVSCTDAAAASCSFTLSGDDGNGASCAFDSNPAVPCTSPHVYAGPALALGPHTFTVTSTDDYGNDGSASDTFTVPMTATIAIHGPADGADVNVPPSYSFTVNGKADHGVRCELDGMRIDCPFNYPNGVIALAEPSQGTHTVRVSVLDAPKATRTKSRPSLQPRVQVGESASRSFTFDNVAPAITIDAAPRALMNDDTARVAFSTTGAASTTCQVDGAAAKACRDELVVEKLVAGAHTIDVVAFDKAGNVAKATTSFVTDPVAACLDGSSDFGLAAVPDLTHVGGSTVEMWFRAWTATDALDLFALDDPSTETAELAVSFEQDAFVVATATDRVRLPIALELNAWHHIAVEMGRDRVTLFVDGVASGTVRVAGLDGIALGDKPVLWLGLDRGAGHAPGAFADVRVSRGAVYERGFRPTYPAQAGETTFHLFPADEGADLLSEDMMARGTLTWSTQPAWGTCEAEPASPMASVLGASSGSAVAPTTMGMAP